ASTRQKVKKSIAQMNEGVRRPAAAASMVVIGRQKSAPTTIPTGIAKVRKVDCDAIATYL
ncbi:MAG: hypothetical protein II361_00610, partial [Alistipes sp.]|nr:hypothetical protein [Alistipes sp.]